MRLPLVHRLLLAVRLARGAGMPLRARLPLVALLLYLALPLDIIPDFIPIAGQLDDVLVASLAVWWFLRIYSPRAVLAEIARLEATPLGPLGRRAPWLLALVLGMLLAGAVLVWWRGSR